jgi:hypothetical protein
MSKEEAKKEGEGKLSPRSVKEETELLKLSRQLIDLIDKDWFADWFNRFMQCFGEKIKGNDKLMKAMTSKEMCMMQLKLMNEMKKHIRMKPGFR